MQRNWCHVTLAFLLKLLNFLQAFFGISILLYSIWMLDQWNHRVSPSPPYPEVAPSFRGFRALEVTAFGSLNSLKLASPWFIYTFMGVGIIVCCINLIGCIAAESINGCCLCFYAILKTVLILVEAALVAFVIIDRRWEEDIPFDPTGELLSIRSFVKQNVEICKWVGIVVVVIQVLALLVAMILRALVSILKRDPELDDENENYRGRIQEPLINQKNPSPDSGTHSNIWTSRIREKYALNGNQNAAAYK